MTEQILDYTQDQDPNPDEPLDPEQITRELRNAARQLQRAAAKLGNLTKDFRGRVDEESGEFAPGPGPRFETLVESEMIRIYTKAKAEGKQAPGEDLRKAMASATVREQEPALAAQYDVMSIEIEALKQFCVSQKAVINGHQSVLSSARVLTGFKS